jgi:protein-L-isoaspartate(D-aspartate) O-methyltransferase
MIDVYANERLKMVSEQLVARGINDSRVIAAMAKVPRHSFIRDELRGHSYEDEPVPIGNDQTVSQPYMVALMAEVLELKGSERILEIGTGSGYAAAVFAELCGEVFSVERIEELAIKARLVLTAIGSRNVRIQIGDGTLGWPEEAPFDGIVISAGAPQIPRPLLDQLKPGGNFVLPMGEEELQTLVRLRKTPSGLKEEYFGECRFVKLRGTHGWQD